MNPTKAIQIDYFSKMYKQNKGSTMAVSSESLAHKILRYDKISQIFENESVINVHDIGMGLADFYKYLLAKFPEKQIVYSGSDIVSEYVLDCHSEYPDFDFYLRDIAENQFDDKYDFVVLSGVFHQKRETSIPDFEKFWQALLANAFLMCEKGIAFNFVSPFVDFYQEQVYYCNLNKLLLFITEKMSRFFRIEHNYALFEFTVFVYKEEYIREIYPEQEFEKYFKVKR